MLSFLGPKPYGLIKSMNLVGRNTLLDLPSGWSGDGPLSGVEDLDPGRVRCTFNLMGAGYGRISVSKLLAGGKRTLCMGARGDDLV